MPSRHHWFAFRKKLPAGSHWMMASQISQASESSGMRMQKRNMCHGSSKGVLAGGEIGKNGAIPEPICSQLAAVSGCWQMSAPLSLYCPYFSMSLAKTESVCGVACLAAEPQDCDCFMQAAECDSCRFCVYLLDLWQEDNVLPPPFVFV